MFSRVLCALVTLTPLAFARTEAPGEVEPEEWRAIRAAYEAERHSVHPVEGGHSARNPAQRWSTRFDGRGFDTLPDTGGWTWGLELERYGFGGHERRVTGVACVHTAGGRVSYGWDATLEEWFVNDARGLEHGFTVRRRPEGAARGEASPLLLTMAVRGDLRPEVAPDGRGVSFRDGAGVVMLTYTGLTVLDADGAELDAGFQSRPDGLRLTIDERGARYPLTIDPVAQQAYLKAASTDGGDEFGESVAVSGDTVVVGAHYESSNATGVNGDPTDNTSSLSGAAYVFVSAGGVWSQQAYLKASNTNPYDRFGGAVAISGDTIVVGATGEASGSMGVNGNQLDNSMPWSGAAYVFVRNGTTWTQEAYLKPYNTDLDDNFGWSVALSGDTAVIGSHRESSDATGVDGDPYNNNAYWSGAAYVFQRTGTSWSQEAYLKASNNDVRDWFGYSVAVSGDTVVVGANHEDSDATGVNGDESDDSSGDAGAAYVFVRGGAGWSQEAYLKATNTDSVDDFGRSVAASVDTVLIGAPHEDSNAVGVNGDQNDDSLGDSGAAYVYVRSGTSWSPEAYLKASNPDAADQFGRSVAVSGDKAVIGAPYEDGVANGVQDSGAAYTFVRTGTSWAQQAYLESSNPDAHDHFGESAAVAGDVAVIGAESEASSATGVNGNQGDNSAPNAGAAYVFGLDEVVATCQWYCGTGVNAATDGFQVTAPAVLGGTFVASVTGCAPGNVGSLLAAYYSPLSYPSSWGEILVNIGDPHDEILGVPAALGSPAVFNLPVPNDPLLTGVVFYIQALSFGGTICLHCAYECTIGL